MVFTIVGFCFEKYERSEFIVAFALALGVSGVKPLISVAQKGRSPLCVCWLTTFLKV